MYNVKTQNEDFVLNIDISNLNGEINEKPFILDSKKIQDGLYHVIKDNKSYNIEIVEIEEETKTVTLKINGTEYISVIKDEKDILLQSLGISSSTIKQVNQLKAPMPGLLRDILVSEGQEVKTGEILIVLEAMKMENNIKSPSDLKIKSIVAKKGDTVEKNQLIMLFE
jgi:biotin carboxyl carrier protein